jgi:biotin carboxyl carrier protein
MCLFFDFLNGHMRFALKIIIALGQNCSIILMLISYFYFLEEAKMIRIKLSQNEAKTFDKEAIEKYVKDMDVRPLGNDYYSVIYNSRSHEIAIHYVDKATKTIHLTIDGVSTEATLSNEIDLLLEKMGIDTTASSKLTVLKAPMPGLVVDWFVAPGDEVKTGDRLLLLEAMKMENVIKASGEGKVKKICIQKGLAIEKNQLLIEFE